MELSVPRREAHLTFRENLARQSVRTLVWQWFVTFIVFAGALVMLFPVAFMLSTSLKTSGNAFLIPIRWLPDAAHPPQWGNFPYALNFMNWSVVYRNTVIIAGGNMLGDTISACIVAYGFARFRAPGRQFLFTMVLATLMIPYQVRLVPEYLGWAKIGAVDTFWPLMTAPWFGSAFNIFLLRQFFMSIPIEMDEAAKIDGAGPLTILMRVLIPQVRPALAAVAIGSFTFYWSDFLRPLIYLNQPSHRTAAIALTFFSANYGATPYNYMMAASLEMLLPILILFFVAQRYFIQGIVVSGVKG